MNHVQAVHQTLTLNEGHSVIAKGGKQYYGIL